MLRSDRRNYEEKRTFADFRNRAVSCNRNGNRCCGCYHSIYYVCKLGTLSGFPAILLCAVGIILTITSIIIWFIGAVRSDMDVNIKDNRLKTNGIYAWVRNPMYSGWWMLISGISLFWHNIWLIPVIFINWCIMTVVLKNTEEKWLYDLYGHEYEDYCKRVNRCIPWKRTERNY